MKKQFFYLLALVVIVVISCQKEMSFELGNSPGSGTLKSDVSGDCLPKTVNGTYSTAVPLVPTTNTITVQVNVTKTGTYVITTDTVNGYYFRAVGTFTTLGATTITMRGNGTPFASGINNFVVSFDGTVCDIQVTVAAPAVFTLDGAPGACTGATVAGGYATTIPLTASNTATINVNVATAGAFTITTSYQGMTFKKSGIFTMTGPQPVVLDGSGTPSTAGVNHVPLTAGATTCSFDVTVGSPGTGTLGGGPGACTPSTVHGTYTQNTNLDATNTVDVNVTVATAGVCSITTTTIDGFSFSFSGTLAAGPQTVTLVGTGNPINPGPQNFTVSFGTSTCTFAVTVVAGPTIDWKFTVGSTTYQGSTDAADLDGSTAPFTLFDYLGTNPASDDFSFDLIDLSGGINASETYNSASTTSNISSFYFSDAGSTIDLTADPSTPSVSIIFKITSHNTATKTISGTFSGTALDAISSTTKTITNGTFTAVYP